MDNKYEVSFNSQLKNVQNVLKQILLFLDQNYSPLSSDDHFDLKLMFSELLCNAVRHGNQSDKDKLVHVLVMAKNEGIHVTIADEGPGFNYEAVFQKKFAGEELDAENGRGIRLVKSLADEMSFNQSGSEVKFFKRVTTIG